jgi:hypothetical protein
VVSLKHLIQAAEMPVTIRHERWLAQDYKPFSDQALDFSRLALSKEAGGGRRRTAMFRASGSGTCRRRQMFRVISMPGRYEIDPKLASIFMTGDFVHLKWQMAGLTAGWLDQAEVAWDSPELNLGGTLDGILDDGSGLEIKSINTRGFSMVNKFGADPKHLRQVHSYMKLTEIDTFSIVYEDKNTQDYREFRVRKDPEIMASVEQELDELNESLQTRTLPQVLPLCQSRDGSEYRNCPFRDTCLTIKEWPS